MAAIKKFFEKRKLDIKFKRAGEGVKLADSKKATPPSQPAVKQRRPPDMTAEARMAADAAMARMSLNQQKPTGSSASLASMKSQARREMQDSQSASSGSTSPGVNITSPREVVLDAAPITTTAGVYFYCALLGEERLPKEAMIARIEEFLLAQLAEEPEMTSALMIHSLNPQVSPDKIKLCIETIAKYLDNIIDNPGEEKYRRIRAGNRALADRVLAFRGAAEFLQAAGFERRMLPVAGPDDPAEEHLVMDAERAADVDRLRSLKDILATAEPIRPELDRNAQVFHPLGNAARISVPDEFYAINPEEIKREQEIRREAVEQMGMLRTKQMRERDRARELRRYRYCLMRVRFPDGILLQGTFRAKDKLSAVVEFVRDSLVDNWIPFTLSTQTGKSLADSENLSLAELDLAPASVLSIVFDPSVIEEVSVQRGALAAGSYLSPELMAIITSL